jgi:hypothetical protein
VEDGQQILRLRFAPLRMTATCGGVGVGAGRRSRRPAPTSPFTHNAVMSTGASIASGVETSADKCNNQQPTINTHKKSGQTKVVAGFKPATTSVPSHKIAFLFEKTQDLQEERFFTIQVALLISYAAHGLSVSTDPVITPHIDV